MNATPNHGYYHVDVPHMDRPDLRSAPGPLFPSVPMKDAVETDTTQTGIKLTLMIMEPTYKIKKANLRTRDGKMIIAALAFLIGVRK